jgi:acetylornithine/succinyldiaminopimelate/putrescine aminotransferase
MAALSATGQASKQEAFTPLLTGFDHVPLNDLATLEDAVGADTCAIMLEPVQGEGGVYPCDEEYLRAVRRLCDEREVLLILDEVQTGFFRTGTPFAWQGYGVRPDVMMLAKSLANGLPAGAVLASGTAAEVFAPGDHGSTFGGGPVIAAAALATIEALVAEGAGERAARTGVYLREGLERLSADSNGAITDVRSRGLMAAIELRDSCAQASAAAALEQGVVINAIGDRTLRFLPPLVCTERETDILFHTLQTVLGDN